MNKIIIDNNILNNYIDDNIEISNNIIYFLKNGEYNIEYNNCKNLNITYHLKENVTIKLFIYSINNNLETKEIYNLNNNSNLLLFKFYNNHQIKENTTINLNGQYSKINYSFSNICTKKEEYNIKINHNNKNTESYINNRCISLDKSLIDYNIDSILPKGNPKCIMDQVTKIFALGNTNSKINPNMYIEETDVEARHGSVIGKFSDDDIFYLTSRGIPEKDATKLLIKGFLLSNIIPNDNILENILNIINEIWR